MLKDYLKPLQSSVDIFAYLATISHNISFIWHYLACEIPEHFPPIPESIIGAVRPFFCQCGDLNTDIRRRVDLLIFFLSFHHPSFRFLCSISRCYQSQRFLAISLKSGAPCLFCRAANWNIPTLKRPAIGLCFLSHLAFLLTENRAERSCTGLLSTQTTWITICWELSMEFFPQWHKKSTAPSGFIGFLNWVDEWGLTLNLNLESTLSWKWSHKSVL